MIAETYACALSCGRIEYGYCFKVEGGDDTEFDIPLGIVSPDKFKEDLFAEFKPKADRIAEALKDFYL